MTTLTATPSPAAPGTPVHMTGTKAWASAIVSGLLAFLSAIATALGGAETGFDSITAGQWVTAVTAGIAAAAASGGITFAVPNRPK